MAAFGGRAKEVFLAALSHPAADRPAFVEAACGGDEALRLDVESLLAAHDENERADSDPFLSSASVSHARFAPGEIFADRYRMVTRLGQGGMGDVWRADDLILGSPVALKFIREVSGGARAAILNEVRLARTITHPAVCRVFDVGEAGGEVFFSMELVSGEDLASLLRRVGRLPSEKVLDIARQLCDGLGAAHTAGVLHRDLKPANVLIDDAGCVRITDFGIAVTRHDGGRRTGVGTPGYMAPEQLTSGAAVSEQTDIYALGLILYELLVGQHVFDPSDAGHKRQRPSAVVAGVDPRLERAIMHALSPDPLDRPRSARDLAAMLSAGAKSPVAARAPIRPIAFALAAAAVVAIVVFAWRVLPRGGARTLTAQDTILLADFNNTTGEPVFDGTLKVALAVAMEQSPFIKVLPDERVRQALRLMNRPADERVTRSVAREIARREQLKALLAGSIASLGRNYVMALEAVNAETGDVMAREQVEVTEKEQVLASLGRAAARLREKLGESLASIQRFDVPLPRATTSSLEALHSYALGLDEDRLVARAGAVPHLKRAIELDPDFALAQALLSGVYANSGRTALAPELSRRAFELRDRVSERERFFISWRYYHDATQDWNKALELAQSWTATYPREPFAFNSLGAAHSFFGRYERAIEAFRSAIRLDPAFVASLENLAAASLALNRLDDVRVMVRRASAERPDLVNLRRLAYLAAFVAGDAAGMMRELEAARRLPEAVLTSDWDARIAAFSGRARSAHGQFRAAVQHAVRADLPETAAQWSTADAEAHALRGECADARNETTTGLSLSRDNVTLERAGRALALCGASAAAARLATELAERFPDATLTTAVARPTIDAAVAIRDGDAQRAMAILEPVRPYDELRGADFWPAYLRGQAALMLKDAKEAAAQFEKILSHRGHTPDSLLYALAHLGLGRAAALAGDAAKARASYAAFLLLWQGADADARPLQDAHREYAQIR